MHYFNQNEYYLMVRFTLKRLIPIVILSVLFACSSAEIKNSGSKLKGFYSYLADSALFYDCETNKTYPISFEGDNLALERAYLNVKESDGEKILVTLIGTFELRNKIDGNGKTEFLVVSKFLNIWPNIDCSRNLGTANFNNTFWKLYEISGKSLNISKPQKDIHFIIDSDNNIKGFAGCNNFFGNVAILNDSIKFSQIGATRKMCNENMEIEKEFFVVLKKANKYKIYGEFLYFYDKNELIAKFESVYFN